MLHLDTGRHHSVLIPLLHKQFVHVIQLKALTNSGVCIAEQVGLESSFKSVD